MVEAHIVDFGVNDFLVGHYGGFDRIATQAVIAAKRVHPEIRLSLLLPYHPAERPIETPAGFDDTYYPPGMEAVPRRFAIVKANRCAIEQSDYLIAHARYPASNAKKLVEYAQRRAQRNLIVVHNLAENSCLTTNNIE